MEKQLDSTCLHQCPKCESEDVMIVDSFYQENADTSFDVHVMECADCGARWNVIWKFDEAFIEEEDNNA